MEKPKIILFDFGDTLMTDENDFVAGMRRVLSRAAANPRGVTPEQVQAFAGELLAEITRYHRSDVCPLDMHNFMFERYLYEYFGLEFAISFEEIEREFLTGAMISRATPGVAELLAALKAEGVRTAVISNTSFSGTGISEWIARLLPDHAFEFIIATSEYVFKKPSPRIFELALRKAGVDAAEAWYCGNSYFHDVHGAAQSGLHPVWYKGANWDDKPGCPRHPCTEITHWDELAALVRGL